MVKLNSIEKYREKLESDKFECRDFCYDNKIDVRDLESLEYEISDVLWGIAREDEDFKKYPYEEIEKYLSDFGDIIWDGVINAS